MPVQRFIDFNRGSDSNSGASPAAAWKTLGKMLTETRTAGDEILLANDSVFDLSTRVLINSALGWSSTKYAPITIGSYAPLSASSGKPVIRKFKMIAANEWTYSAPNNAWTFTTEFAVSAGARLKLGGQWAIRTDGGIPLTSTDRLYSNSGTTVYVYAPAGTNPTDYYGSVEFSGDSSDSPFVISSPTPLYGLVMRGIRFEQACGPSIYNSSATRHYTFSDLEAEECGVVVSALTEAGGSVNLLVERVTARASGTYMIAAYNIGGVGIGSWHVRDCVLSDTHHTFPQGAIYSQVRNADVQIYRNKIFGMRYGVPGKAADGCAIYTETGADNNFVWGNEVWESHCAFQDNSGRRQFWIGNVVRDCYGFLKLTDENNHNSTDCRVYNNTVIRAGAPVLPAFGAGVSGIGLWAYETTTPAMKIDARNNLMTMHAACANPQPGFELPTSVDGSSAIVNNLVFGFPQVAAAYNGGSSPVTSTGTLELDPTPYLNADYSLKPVVDIGGVPMRNPLDGAGVWVQGGRTFDGAPLIPGRVPIGARMPTGRMR